VTSEASSVWAFATGRRCLWVQAASRWVVGACGSPGGGQPTRRDFPPIPKSLPLSIGGRTAASGGAFGGAGGANNRKKARSLLLSPRVSHSLSLGGSSGGALGEHLAAQVTAMAEGLAGFNYQREQVNRSRLGE
jgi:hypothetical protein